MSEIQYSTLLRANNLYLRGRYFELESNSNFRFGTFFSKSFIFSLLVQLRTKKNRIIASLANILLIYLYQSDVGRGAVVSESLFFPHPSGIIIGSGTTLEGKIIVFDRTSFGKKYPGTLSGMPKFHGEGVIGSGAKILGDVVVSEKFVIAANAVLLHDLKNQTFTGNKIVQGVYFENRIL